MNTEETKSVLTLVFEELCITNEVEIKGVHGDKGRIIVKVEMKKKKRKGTEGSVAKSWTTTAKTRSMKNNEGLRKDV